MKRALVFAFIYRGAPNWAATDGVVTVNMPDQPPVEVRLDGGCNQNRWLAIFCVVLGIGGCDLLSEKNGARQKPVHAWERQEIVLFAEKTYQNYYTDVDIWV